MNILSKTLLAATAVLVTAAGSHATIVMAISGRNFADQFGTVLPAGTLLQLVNLGADGVFNQINLADGSNGALTQWVSGDDTLINFAFADSNTHVLDPVFSSAAAFDFSNGTDTAGRLGRSFEFEDGLIPVGAKIGIRFFAGLQATNFSTITLQAGQRYGEFTRQAPEALQHLNTDYWTAPAAGQSYSFDSLQTASAPTPGNDANSRGQTLLTVVPEPTSAILGCLGAIGMLGLRRRRN